MRSALVFLFCLLGLSITPARADPLQGALNAAIAAFEQARPAMVAESFGVDLVAYGDALTLGRFRQGRDDVVLALEQGAAEDRSCARFAAFVRLPARNGEIALVVCPQFSREGTPALRRLTILHEMVHVVAGADECRAMAFAARVEELATGSYTDVGRYWRANGCESSAFSLP